MKIVEIRVLDCVLLCVSQKSLVTVYNFCEFYFFLLNIMLVLMIFWGGLNEIRMFVIYKV